MIAILTQCFPSRIGGIESLISNLAMGLSKVCEVVVFADKYEMLAPVIASLQYKSSEWEGLIDSTLKEIAATSSARVKSDLYLSLAKIYMRQFNDTDKAVESLKNSIESDGGNHLAMIQLWQLESSSEKRYFKS